MAMRVKKSREKNSVKNYTLSGGRLVGDPSFQDFRQRVEGSKAFTCAPGFNEVARAIYTREALVKAFMRLRILGEERGRDATVESVEERQLQNFVMRGWEAWDVQNVLSETNKNATLSLENEFTKTATARARTRAADIAVAITENDAGFAALVSRLDPTQGIVLQIGNAADIREAQDVTMQLVTLRREIGDLREALKASEGNVRGETAAASVLRAEFLDAKAVLEAQLATLETQHRQKVAGLTLLKGIEVSKLSKTLRETEASLADELARSQAEARARLDDLRREREAELAARDAALSEARAERAAALETLANDRARNAADVNEARTGFTAEAAALRERVAALEDINKNVGADNDALKAALSAAKRDCVAALQKVQAELTQGLGTQIRGFEARVLAFDAEVRANESGREETLRAFEREKVAMRQDFEGTVAALRVEHIRALDQLRREANEMSRTIDALRADKDAIEAEVVRARDAGVAALSDMRAEYQRAMAALADEKAKTEDLSLRLRRAEETTASAEARAARLTRDLQDARSEMAETIASSAKTAAERATIRTYLEEVERAVKVEFNVVYEAEREERESRGLVSNVLNAIAGSGVTKLDTIAYKALTKIQLMLIAVLDRDFQPRGKELEKFRTEIGGVLPAVDANGTFLKL